MAALAATTVGFSSRTSILECDRSMVSINVVPDLGNPTKKTGLMVTSLSSESVAPEVNFSLSCSSWFFVFAKNLSEFADKLIKISKKYNFYLNNVKKNSNILKNILKDDPLKINII